MPVDFGSGSAALVELGYGAHSPQIRFTAGDESCMWNGFPVCLGYDLELLPLAAPAAVFSTYQLSSFTTTAGGSGSQPSSAQWPYAYIYDYLGALLNGYKLQARVRFTATSAGTSVGSVGVGPVGSTPCGAKPGPIIGVYDSGWFDMACGDCSVISAGVIPMYVTFTNFSPIAGSVTITNGILDLQWVADTGPIATYAPSQVFGIQYRPPCHLASGPSDLDAGLYIALETNTCGHLTKNYTQVASAVNALSLGITATVLGGHGADIAQPDPDCTPPIYCCDMAGADCTGASDN